MSGPTCKKNSSPDPTELAARIRQVSGVSADSGPADKHLVDAVRGFVDAFDYWYIRVMREAVPKYRQLIIARINPFIRTIECKGLSLAETASKLVGDYNSRNFVTAGGWALEEMAVRVSPDGQKAAAEGIDVQRLDPESGDYHLYVLKSGLVTRNSDIIKALKRNVRQAEKLLLQGQGTGNVHAYYAIAAGKTSSTFEDGIHRPSSAEFWAQIMNIGSDQAIELALAIAAEAGALVLSDASAHVTALELLVSDYISDRKQPDQVDWEFIATRNMQAKTVWMNEDKDRHQRAMIYLSDSGYEIAK